MRRAMHTPAVAGVMVLAAGVVGCKPDTERPSVPVVTVWAHQGRERENAAMREIVAAFNRTYVESGPQIELTFFPDRQYPDKVSIASASGALPDVVDIDGPYVGPWAAEGLLVPIDEFVDPELRADLLPSLIEQGTFRERLYAVGAFESALVVYYNLDLIERAGLKPPEQVDQAWSWNEFVEALERVKLHAALPLSLHMDEPSDEWVTYAFSPLIWSNGGRLLDVETGRCAGVLNAEANIAAIQRWQRLFADGLAEARSTNPDPFGAGVAAFDWTGHWMLPGFEQTPGLRFGVMPLPQMGDRPVCASGSWCWGISRACQDQAAAWTVIRWLIDPEHGIRPICEANGAVPGRRSAFRHFPEYDRLPRRLFRQQLEVAAHPRPRTGAYLTLTSALARSLRDISTGTDVQASLSEAARRVQRVLDAQQRQGP